MSAYILGKSGDAMHFFTDGGLFADDGTLIGIYQKTHVIAHMPAAVTFLGSELWGAMLYVDMCRERPEFDQVLAEIVEMLKNYEEKIVQMLGAPSPKFECLLVGYSKSRKGLARFIITNNDLNQLEKWKLVELEEDTINPLPSPEALRAVGWTFPDSFDVGREGKTIMQAQRLTLLPHKDGTIASGVGGFIQHTIIKCDQITTRIVHRWPDEVGKRLAPEAA